MHNCTIANDITQGIGNPICVTVRSLTYVLRMTLGVQTELFQSRGASRELWERSPIITNRGLPCSFKGLVILLPVEVQRCLPPCFSIKSSPRNDGLVRRRIEKDSIL